MHGFGYQKEIETMPECIYIDLECFLWYYEQFYDGVKVVMRGCCFI